MRGVAAFAVLIHHCLMVTGVQFLPGGFLSVDLFFVLSGFVIALSYESRLHDGLSLSGFLRARAKRLLPTHFWAFGIVLLVTLAAFASGNLETGVTLPSLLGAAIMNAMLIPDFMTDAVTRYAGAGHYPFPINPTLWSLFDEWVVSILYAAAIFGARTRTVLAAGAVAAVFATRFGLHFAGWNFGDEQMTLLPSVFRALAGFAAGVLIFRMHKQGLLTALPSVPPWCFYAVWLLICSMRQAGSSFALECTVAIVVAPLTVALLVRSEGPGGAFFRWLGSVSYPLYVSHLAVLVAIGSILKYLDLAGRAIYALPIIALALGLAQCVKMLSEIRPTPAAKFTSARQANS